MNTKKNNHFKDEEILEFEVTGDWNTFELSDFLEFINDIRLIPYISNFILDYDGWTRLVQPEPEPYYYPHRFEPDRWDYFGQAYFGEGNWYKQLVKIAFYSEVLKKDYLYKKKRMWFEDNLIRDTLKPIMREIDELLRKLPEEKQKEYDELCSIFVRVLYYPELLFIYPRNLRLLARKFVSKIGRLEPFKIHKVRIESPGIIVLVGIGIGIIYKLLKLYENWTDISYNKQINDIDMIRELLELKKSTRNEAVRAYSDHQIETITSSGFKKFEKYKDKIKAMRMKKRSKDDVE